MLLLRAVEAIKSLVLNSANLGAALKQAAVILVSSVS